MVSDVGVVEADVVVVLKLVKFFLQLVMVVEGLSFGDGFPVLAAVLLVVIFSFLLSMYASCWRRRHNRMLHLLTLQQ